MLKHGEGFNLADRPRKGRGAISNQSGRYEPETRQREDDGWLDQSEAEEPRLETSVQADTSRKVIARNQSPDVPFDRSINPYRGCEHGCVYCFARPTHAWLGLSPGLDFETKLFAKYDAAEILERELSKPSYKPDVIALGFDQEHAESAIRAGLDERGYNHIELVRVEGLTEDLDGTRKIIDKILSLQWAQKRQEDLVGDE